MVAGWCVGAAAEENMFVLFCREGKEMLSQPKLAALDGPAGRHVAIVQFTAYIFIFELSSKTLCEYYNKIKSHNMFDQISRYRYCDNIVGMIVSSSRSSDT